MIDLQQYMSGSIRQIMGKAYRNVLRNPRQAQFALKMQRVFEQSARASAALEAGRDCTCPRFHREHRHEVLT